ncbi:MAG: MarR family transcriptional regulator [Pseudomonadota bacterium]
MAYDNFAYGTAAANGTGASLSLAVFADRPHVRQQLAEDAAAAGFRVTGSASVGTLIEDDAAKALAEVVVVDCPAPDGAGLAALTRLDVRARQSGAHLIVSTTVAALEDVFACLDQSQPQLLVDPSAADMALALGRALSLSSPHGVREMADEDRMQLLHLTEQVSRMAARLDGFGTQRASADGVFRVESPALAFRSAAPQSADLRLAERAPALPEAAIVRRILRQRQQRGRFFDGDLFADPAWDMLLDLTAARAERKRVSVTSLCIAAGVPPTTALRWIGQMTHSGLFRRVEDTMDRRRAFIDLTDAAADGMARYFAAIGEVSAFPL